MMKKMNKILDKKGVAHFRCLMGADILERMEAMNDLPLPNKHRLVKVMEEYLRKDPKFKKYILDANYTFIPDRHYWFTHLPKVMDILLQERRKPFNYFIPKNKIKGAWKFLDEDEYVQMMERKLLDLNTREESFNHNIDNGNQYLGLNLQFRHFVKNEPKEIINSKKTAIRQGK